MEKTQTFYIIFYFIIKKTMNKIIEISIIIKIIKLKYNINYKLVI